jgi:hypothetical protein
MSLDTHFVGDADPRQEHEFGEWRIEDHNCHKARNADHRSGLPEVLVAVCTSRPSCRKAGKREYSR